MATTQAHSRQRRYRKLKHQHALTQFKTIAHLSILEDYGVKRFRRHLKDKITYPLYLKIEVGESGRPHYHLISTSHIPKSTFRQLIHSCLQGEKFDLRVEKVEQRTIHSKLWYIAKPSNYDGRCEASYCNFWTENTQALSKQTTSERRKTVSNMLRYGADDKLRSYVMLGVLDADMLDKAGFSALWRNCLRHDPKLEELHELLLLNTYPQY